MSSPPSLRDVASLAKVSIGTVSNVLNHPDKVSKQTRLKVEDAIATLRFTPNQNARALVSGTSKTIALVVTELTNSFFVDIARGAQREARRLGWHLLLCSSDNDLTQQSEHLALLESARVNGLILAPMEESTDDIEALRRHGRSVVVVNYRSHATDACCVLVDNEQAGYLALKHLASLGHRRISFVFGRNELQPVEHRRRGVLRALSEYGAVELLELEMPDLDLVSGALAGQRILEMNARPDAVLAVTDLLAMGIISEFAASGARTPDDIAVMGCDHNASAWGGATPLTSMAMQGEEIGMAAVKLLVEEMAGPAEAHHHRTVIVSSEVVARESTLGRRALAARALPAL